MRALIIAERIHSLLVAGGVWINEGPLLWHDSLAEISLEQLLHLVELCGFRIAEKSMLIIRGLISVLYSDILRKHESSSACTIAYTANKNSMVNSILRFKIQLNYTHTLL